MTFHMTITPRWLIGGHQTAHLFLDDFATCQNGFVT
jgi:hypothetical protein